MEAAEARALGQCTLAEHIDEVIAADIVRHNGKTCFPFWESFEDYFELAALFPTGDVGEDDKAAILADLNTNQKGIVVTADDFDRWHYAAELIYRNQLASSSVEEEPWIELGDEQLWDFFRRWREAEIAYRKADDELVIVVRNMRVAHGFVPDDAFDAESRVVTAP